MVISFCTYLICNFCINKLIHLDQLVRQNTDKQSALLNLDTYNHLNLKKKLYQLHMEEDTDIRNHLIFSNILGILLSSMEVKIEEYEAMLLLTFLPPRMILWSLHCWLERTHSSYRGGDNCSFIIE